MKTMAGKIICKALILMLLTISLISVTACADEADSFPALLNRIASNDGNIVLTNNISVTQPLEIGENKNIRIDLNGHHLTRSNSSDAMFSIVNGGTLTVWDSKTAAAAETVLTTPPPRDSDPSDGTGIALPIRLNNGILTYYETRSTVNSDGISTTETRYQNTVNVNNMGAVLGDGTVSAELFSVFGNSVLNIESGAFSNPGGRIIKASAGATLNLTGGYFYSSTADSGNGGAVYISGAGSTATIGGVRGKEAVFAGNTAAAGGAISVENNATLNIHEGAVFTGNKASGDEKCGGGAIYIKSPCSAAMDGGLVTNNWCSSNTLGSDIESSYHTGGGGIRATGTLLMTGGQVTHNEAAGGGGINTGCFENGVLIIRGGVIAGNVARINEGGGISINMSSTATIVGTENTPTYITNNVCDSTEHWGGGGVFLGNFSYLRMRSIVITDNKAGGFGGGLAGCSTGRISFHASNTGDHSIALWDNSADGTTLSGGESTKNADHVYAASNPVFMREGDYYQDYYCALYSNICGGMLGGGKAMWTGTAEGKPISPADFEGGKNVIAQYVTGMNSAPSKADIDKAIDKGHVFVNGNRSATHGGGILINGYMYLGSESEIDHGDFMAVKGNKTITGGTVEEDFTFLITDADGNLISTGTSHGDGEIAFNRCIPFAGEGTYTYWIYESDKNLPDHVEMDTTRYRMVVTVSSDPQEAALPDADDPDASETVFATPSKVSLVEIFKHRDARDAEGTPIATYPADEIVDRYAYELAFVFEFENLFVRPTELTVKKTVIDPSGRSNGVSFPFTVTLDDPTINGTYGDMTFRNGVAVFQLGHQQSITATGLPVGTRYEVTENSRDYTASSTGATGVITKEQTSLAVFVNSRSMPDLPKTGDQTPLMLCVSMALISAGILTLLYRKSKKA